jgi:excisionase family DNA binding protein
MSTIQTLSAAESERRTRQRAMSIAQFSDRYGPSRTKIYEEINAGRLRAVKCGNRTLITEDDAEAWLRALPSVADARGIAMSPMCKHCNEVEGSVLRAPIKPGISEKRSPEKAQPCKSTSHSDPRGSLAWPSSSTPLIPGSLE